MKGWFVAALAMGVPWLGAMLWFQWGTPEAEDAPRTPAVIPVGIPVASEAGKELSVRADVAVGETTLSDPMRLAGKVSDWVRHSGVLESIRFPEESAEGFADLSQGRYEQARACFDRVLAHDGDHPTAMLGYAMALAQQRNWDDAALAYERLIEKCDGSALLWAQYGDVCSRANKPTAAIGAYERALALEPTRDRTRFNLAIHYQAAGRARDALEEWRKLTDRDGTGQPAPDADRTQTQVACPYDVLSVFDTASQPELTAAMLADAWHHRGEAAMEIHQVDEAVTAFRRVVDDDARLISGWCNLGIALSAKAQYDEAMRALERALELDARCLPAVNQMVFIHARRFHVLRDNESHAVLMHWCERSLAIHPKQENILALRRAAGQVELDGASPACEGRCRQGCPHHNGELDAGPPVVERGAGGT